jgi:hypothetical protein
VASVFRDLASLEAQVNLERDRFGAEIRAKGAPV